MNGLSKIAFGLDQQTKLKFKKIQKLLLVVRLLKIFKFLLSLQVELEKRGRKSVGVRVELAGELAPGYQIREVRSEPGRVWLTGARSQVLELEEVVTEPIDISGLSEDREVEAKLFVGAGTVWLEEENPIRVVVGVEPVPEPESDMEQGAAAPEEAPS